MSRPVICAEGFDISTVRRERHSCRMRQLHFLSLPLILLTGDTQARQSIHCMIWGSSSKKRKFAVLTMHAVLSVDCSRVLLHSKCPHGNIAPICVPYLCAASHIHVKYVLVAQVVLPSPSRVVASLEVLIIKFAKGTRA